MQALVVRWLQTLQAPVIASGVDEDLPREQAAVLHHVAYFAQQWQQQNAEAAAAFLARIADVLSVVRTHAVLGAMIMCDRACRRVWRAGSRG